MPRLNLTKKKRLLQQTGNLYLQLQEPIPYNLPLIFMYITDGQVISYLTFTFANLWKAGCGLEPLHS